MNVKNEIQRHLTDKPLSRVEIGEGHSLSLGFGAKSEEKFLMNHLRNYREIELGTYGKNWSISINSAQYINKKPESREESFDALMGEIPLVLIENDVIILSFPSGRVEFHATNRDDEDFHLFTKSRECLEWKNKIWKMHYK